MNVKAIANADMATLGRWLHEGFAWWIAELAELLPRNWRQKLTLGKAAAVVELRDGDVVARGAADGAMPRSAAVILPAHAALMRWVDVPVLSAADTRRTLALDIDRLTPFRAGDVVFDIEMPERKPDGGKWTVLLGVMPRAVVGGVIARVREAGVEPLSVGIEGENARQFDFLAAYRRGGFAPANGKRAGMWWAIVSALAVANLLVFIYRDEANLDALRDAVESQQTTVAVASRLRHKVDEEAVRRAELVGRVQVSPLRALAALTAALPDTVWTDRVEWNGKTVHVAGYQRGSAPLLRAVEQSPALKHVRSATPAVATQSGIASFDIVADLETGAPR